MVCYGLLRHLFFTILTRAMAYIVTKIILTRNLYHGIE